MIPAYFADGEGYRSADFIRYALQNGSPGMQNTHVRSALYRAKQSDLLRCEGRGRYRFCCDGGGQSENTGQLLQRLKRASAALDWTVNILALSEKEIAAVLEIQRIRSRMDALADALRQAEDMEPGCEPLA